MKNYFLNVTDTGDNIKILSLQTKLYLNKSAKLRANKVFDELFDSPISLYHGNLETSMEGIKFIFDSVQKMHYRCHKINFRCVNSSIDSPDL